MPFTLKVTLPYNNFRNAPLLTVVKGGEDIAVTHEVRVRTADPYPLRGFFWRRQQKCRQQFFCISIIARCPSSESRVYL